MKQIHKNLLLKILFEDGARLMSIGMPSLILNLPQNVFKGAGYQTRRYPAAIINNLTGKWSDDGYILYKIRNYNNLKKYDYAYISTTNKEQQNNIELLYYLLVSLGIKCQIIRPFPKSWHIHEVFTVERVSDIPKERPATYWVQSGMNIGEWPVIYSPYNTVLYSVFVVEPDHFEEVVDRLKRYKIQFSVYKGHIKNIIL